MSGANTNKLSRKDFLIQLAALAIVPAACKYTSHKISGDVFGPNAALGHKLRDGFKPNPTSTQHKKVVIVGGGVSGLTAAYQLQKNGVTDFALLELHETVGGNSLGGQNNVSAYPLGAHYLPIPDHRDTELISFLKECGVVTGFDANGLPIYNEEYLCFDPEERLFINGFWQDGLIPQTGISGTDKAEIEHFLALMGEYKNAVGIDGKDAFCIPVSKCSNDVEFTKLDAITFSAFLTEHNFTSPYLLWYINYCTKDDFGGTASQVSAWAGIHYFAARKGKASNTVTDTVITWPEGNYWLVKQLYKPVKNNIITNTLTYQITKTNEGKYTVNYWANNVAKQLIADYVIVAVPQFVRTKIISKELAAEVDFKNKYMPWMVANITVNKYYEPAHGIPLSWDNVIYGSDGLGYVNAMHQNLYQPGTQQVFTYYKALCNGTPKQMRELAYSVSHKQWVNEVVIDLQLAQPGIKQHITNIDVWIWGHGMILPEPGLRASLQHAKTTEDKLYLAHTDLSGISIFEEAFHQGLRAANQVLSHHEFKG